MLLQKLICNEKNYQLLLLENTTDEKIVILFKVYLTIVYNYRLCRTGLCFKIY